MIEDIFKIGDWICISRYDQAFSKQAIGSSWKFEFIQQFVTFNITTKLPFEVDRLGEYYKYKAFELLCEERL